MVKQVTTEKYMLLQNFVDELVMISLSVYLMHHGMFFLISDGHPSSKQFVHMIFDQGAVGSS